MKKGLFITFEGGDGAGKSTQIELAKDYLEALGFDVVLTREPGGTSIGEKIREIILDRDNSEMDYVTEAMLYAASRAQHVNQVIRPAVDSGRVVISDRFVDSSVAYQGFARGLGDCVMDINRYAVGEYMPDLTFLLKVKPEISKRRLIAGQEDRIELERLEFHQRVYDGYEYIEKCNPDRVIGIDASLSIECISAEIRSHLERICNDI